MSGRVDSGAGLQEFLAPQSMVTPGLAGALVILISGAFDRAFQIDPAITGIIVSVLISLAIMLSWEKIKWPTKCIYVILNSLIVFSLSFGGSGLLNKATAASVGSENTRQINSSIEGKGHQIIQHIVDNNLNTQNSIIHVRSRIWSAELVDPDLLTNTLEPLWHNKLGQNNTLVRVKEKQFFKDWLPVADSEYPILGLRVRLFYCCNKMNDASDIARELSEKGADVIEETEINENYETHAGTIYYYRDKQRDRAQKMLEFIKKFRPDWDFNILKGEGLYGYFINSVSIWLPR